MLIASQAEVVTVHDDPGLVRNPKKIAVRNPKNCSLLHSLMPSRSMMTPHGRYAVDLRLIFNVDRRSMVGVNIGLTKPSRATLGSQTLVYRASGERE
jgi:hypothetical protein